MLQLEVLVGKRFGAVDACTASAVTVEKVTALDHEFSDLRFQSELITLSDSRNRVAVGDRTSKIFNDVQRGGICYLCNPAVDPGDFCSRRYSTDGSFRRSWG